MSKKKKKLTKRLTKSDYGGQQQFDFHLPVLLDEAVNFLITDSNGLYIDGTLGGGGHSREILNRLGVGGSLISYDLDKDAISHCSLKFKDEIEKGDDSRIRLVNSSYQNACTLEEVQRSINGLLLDLGVSSNQLDSSLKGFSFRSNSKLDMRFGDQNTNAEELLNAAEEERIVRLLKIYGEEPFAKPIARRIVERRRAFFIKTSSDLFEIVASVVPPHLLKKSLARVFQAIRISVNNELEILHYTLTNIVPKLAPGGRIVVISYHSLEDRIVKNLFKYFSSSKIKEHQNENNNAISMPVLKILTKKPIIPSEDEMRRNPRSRSAKLRAAERIL